MATNLYPPHAYGGYEALCEAAVTGWRAAGHDVAVLTSDYRRGDVNYDGGDPTVRRRLPVYWRDDRLVTPRLWQRLQSERRTRQVVHATLDELRPDVVSVWNMAALSFGFFDYVADRGVPVVAVIGDRWLTFGPDLDVWSRLFTRRGTLGRAAGAVVTRLTGLATHGGPSPDATVLFGSQYLADKTEATSRYSFTQTAVVHHGVDLDAFPPARDRPERPWSGRLLVVSRIDPRKGLGTTLRALVQVPDTVLDIAGAGSGDHQRELEVMTEELGIAGRVQFLGQRNREQIRDLYLNADVAIVPSEWEEPFGIVPLEALACGAPLVATGTGGSGEFLHHEVNCLRFPPGDAAALAEAVTRLATSPELRAQLRGHGFGTAERLAQDRCLEELEQWHEAAASGVAPPSGTIDQQ